MVIDGWRPRFHCAPLDRWLRWSRTARPRIWLPIDRSDERTLRVEIAYTADNAVRDELAIEIDGERLPSACRRGADDGAFALSGIELKPASARPE